ncbi:MAG: hypothetical protein IPO52_04030 [Gemmatimonadetes bacterium]|nr:hypothetical protein [Gemmatimonadota bacterium]
MDNAFPYNLYGAQQDNSTMRSGSRYRAREELGNMPDAKPVRSFRIRATRNIIYGSCKGQYAVMDLRTGQSKNY